jgi:glycosyltransferase involved in cell wall biosynthesis
MVQKKISIIIPVYNVIEYLDRCLTSVTEQTYTKLEIILVNDGSNDGSEKKCEKWAKKDSRIRYFSQKNQGQGAARNFGIEMATGDYLGFVDSDDWIAVEMMRKLYNKITLEKADVVICDIFHVTKQKDGFVKYIPYPIQTKIVGVTNAKKMPEIIFRTDTCLYDKLYRIELWKENNLTDKIIRCLYRC